MKIKYDKVVYEVVSQDSEGYFINIDGDDIHVMSEDCMVLPDEERMEGGKKYDKGKAPWWLFPFDAAEEIVKVLSFGAYDKGYGEGNWKVVKNSEKRYFSAAIRHLKAHQRGELIDPESGLLHLAHAGCCILFMIWHTLKKPLQKPE